MAKSKSVGQSTLGSKVSTRDKSAVSVSGDFNSKTTANSKVKTEKKSTKLYGQVQVEEAELERFANRTLVRRYEIEFTCPEFTCLCPRSGFPDFATIRIRYVPDRWCVELKSLKLYINKFRNDKIFHEDVTNLILEDLVQLLDPWEIEVIGDFNVRGNIKTVITSRHSKS